MKKCVVFAFEDVLSKIDLTCSSVSLAETIRNAQPVGSMVDLFIDLSLDYTVICYTTLSETYRPQLTEWLRKATYLGFSSRRSILMASKESTGTNSDNKLLALQRRELTPDNVAFVVESYPGTIHALKHNGFLVLAPQ